MADILRIVSHYKRTFGKIILVAGSFAALSGAIATAHSPGVKGLVTINGFFGTGELGREHRRAFLAFKVLALIHPKYRSIHRYFKRELRPERIKVPVLVIHSQADTYVSIAQSQRFYEQLTAPKQFLTLKAADHGITAAEDRHEIVEAIQTWLLTRRFWRQ